MEKKVRSKNTAAPTREIQAAEATALGEGLGRVGIKAHFVRRGTYKTAPELFTHAHVSDIQRQTIESFLDEQYVELVDSVARAPRVRRPTKPTLGSRRRRLEAKNLRSQVKVLRGRVSD